MSLKDYALSYVRDLKWSIFPCVPRTKKPLIKWGPYQSRLPTIEEVEGWWNKWPEANIGVVCGKFSGIVCVDIDAQDALEYYQAEFGEVHNTIRQKTGKPNGLHLVFYYPLDGKPYRNIGDTGKDKETAVEIHCRGDGGFFMAAPSIHPNGTQYQWVLDPTESPDDIMDLPEDVKILWGYGTKKRVKKESKAKSFDLARYLDGADEPGYPGAGESGRIIGRDEACVRLIGHYLNVNEPEIVRKTMYGWGKLCRPVFSEPEIDKCLDSILKKRGRSELGDAIGGSLISKITILEYPDGDVKYNVVVEGFPGYMELDLDDMTIQGKFIKKYLALTRTLLVPMKNKVWAALITQALKESETIKIDEDETNIGIITQAIEDGCRINEVTDMNQIKDHIVSQNGSAFFHMDYIFKILQFRNVKLTTKQIGSILRKIGCSNKEHWVEGKRSQVWKFSRQKLNDQ